MYCMTHDYLVDNIFNVYVIVLAQSIDVAFIVLLHYYYCIIIIIY